MDKQLPPFLKHYDRLAAVAVLIILLLSLLFLVLKGVELQQEVSEYDADLEAGQPSTSQLTPLENTADLALVAAVAKPDATMLLAKQERPDQPNLGTAERRLLCVKCVKPIAWGLETCSFCAAAQPKEEKIDLTAVDRDGDGIPDLEELKLSMDPEDANDADLDKDNDGFTNIEEYLAKTDMADPKSHPGYETRISVKGIQGTKLRIRATSKMQLPSTKDADGKTVSHYQVTFVSVDEDGNLGTKPVRAKDGEPIGKTGFIFERYNELPKKQFYVGEHKQLRIVDVSTVDLKRVADGKKVTTVYYDTNNPEWPGDPLLEQRATLEFDVPGVEPVTVAPGAKFKIKGEEYAVLSVDADKKVVRIQKNANKSVFDLK
ncbi:MAG: hypothetical protein J6V91_05690 [Kiritimatiellae bacterium]|nr:hypothetical protein [Kiritimatiellia bacterium]